MLIIFSLDSFYVRQIVSQNFTPTVLYSVLCGSMSAKKSTQFRQFGKFPTLFISFLKQEIAHLSDQ